MTWEKSNEAHRTLWAYVAFLHKDVETSFEEGGNWQIGYCMKLPPSASVEVRRNYADKFAMGFHQMAFNFVGATCEEGKSVAEAIKAVSDAMYDLKKTLNINVGDIIDEYYFFRSESSI